MILDSFKLNSAIIQLQYDEAFELWDKAGFVARAVCNIWPGVKLAKGQPQQQILRGKGVTLETGLTQATLTLMGPKAFEQSKVQQAKETFEVWREALALNQLKRISTRTTYIKEFASMKEANAELLALNMIRWPNTKVFDQPMEGDRNGVEILFRFEDQNSFSLLTLKAEQLKFEVDLDPQFTDQPEIRSLKNRLNIDFDRGLLGSVDATKFRMDDWIKGYLHILRRDLEKVIRG
jgi:hypothetical protein